MTKEQEDKIIAQAQYILEWCSRSYNIKHAYDILGHKHIKHPIKCIETGIVYDSSVNAANALGLNSSAIRNNAR